MVKKLLVGIFLALFLVVLPYQAYAARTDEGMWTQISTYIKTVCNGGCDVLINGVNKYLNFGSVSGTSGYGIRDNAGVIECKDSGGSWSPCQDGGGIGGSAHNIQDEGVSQTDRANLNFVGAGVTVTDDAGNNASVVTIAGQTPWTQNIVGANYSLSGVGSLDATSSVITQSTSTNLYTANLMVGALNGVLQATNGSVTGGATTSNVPEGSNLYYTLLRWASAMAGTTTDALAEGSNNLYFTNARAQSALTGYFATTTASNTWGGTQSFTNPANFNGITNNGDATTTHLSITGLSMGDLALSSSGRVYSHATTTFSGGLLWSAGNVTNTLTAGDGLTRTVDDFDCDTANASTFGCLPSANFTEFRDKVSSSSLSATYPLAYNSATGAFTFGGLGTTTTWTTGQLAYVVNGNTLTSVATGTLSGTNGVTVTASRYVVGGSATVDCTVASSASAGCLSSANWTTFNNKVATGTSIVTGELPYWLSDGALGSVATGTVSASLPISVTAGRAVIGGALAISIADAVADATTKGASTYTANDFNSSSGNISIDYTNGQAASASNKGFLTTGDWSTFNNKVGSTSLSGASVISYTSGTGVITTAGGTFGAGNYVFPAGVSFTSGTGTSMYASASSTFQILNVGSLTMPSKSDGCATFASGVLNSTGVACGSGGGGGGDSKFSTSTINPLAIYMNAGDSLGLGTTTNRSAYGLLVTATTSPKHIHMRNGDYRWFMGPTVNGGLILGGTTTADGSTSTDTMLEILPGGGVRIQGNSTSSLLNGLNIQEGCFGVRNVCMGVMALNGTQGQVNYFSGTNTVIGTSSLIIATNQYIGIGTTTPGAQLSIVGGLIASSTATSTFQGGSINLITAGGKTGCFAIDGTCITGGSGPGGGSSSGALGTVQFSDGASGFSGDASNFWWDNTNKRLGIGTSSPMSALSVVNTSGNLFTIATSTFWNNTAMHVRTIPSNFAFLNPKNWFNIFLGGATTSQRYTMDSVTMFGRMNRDTLVADCNEQKNNMNAVITADNTAAAVGSPCSGGATYDELTDADLVMTAPGLATTTDWTGATNGCNDGGPWYSISPGASAETQTAGIGGVLRGGAVVNHTVANTPAVIIGGNMTASGTPVMEVTICTPNATASSTLAMMFGFTDVTFGTMPLTNAAAPNTQNGSYLIASSTQNWMLVSHNGGTASANSFINATTISTSTTKSAPQTFRIAKTATATYAYMLDYSQTPPTWTMIGSHTTLQTARPFTWFIGAIQTVANKRRKIFYFRNLQVWYSPTYRF